MILTACRTIRRPSRWPSGSATARAEAQEAGSLGNAYLWVPGLRDLDQAEHWFRHSLSLRPDSDRLGRANCLSSARRGRPGNGSMTPGLRARPSRCSWSTSTPPCAATSKHWTSPPPTTTKTRGNSENQLGIIYAQAGDTGQALRHYQQSIQHNEARGDIYAAGLTRYNIALLLAGDGRISDALHYARAALDNYQQAGPGAASDAADAERLITTLEQGSR